MTTAPIVTPKMKRTLGPGADGSCAGGVGGVGGTGGMVPVENGTSLAGGVVMESAGDEIDIGLPVVVAESGPESVTGSVVMLKNVGLVSGKSEDILFKWF